MDRFSTLLPEIKRHIYAFDNTYKDAFDNCTGEMIVNVLEDVLSKRQKLILYTHDIGSTRMLNYYSGEEYDDDDDGYLTPTNIVRQLQEKFGDASVVSLLVEFKKTLERMCSDKYTAVSNHLDEIKTKTNVMKPETLVKKCEQQLKNHNIKTITSYSECIAMYDDTVDHVAYHRSRKRDDNDRLKWLHNETCIGGYIFPEVCQYGKLCKLLAILNHDIDLFNFEESQPDVQWLYQDVEWIYDEDEL